jgi:2-keto-4-pentenoate hydratase/2-oxohepta-3-ene-1,7-dioic acid hydratase in catechol pathway
MIVGSTADGIVRRRGDQVELLDLPYADLGAALAAGLGATEFGKAPVRATAGQHEVQLRAPVPHPRNVWAVGLAYRDHAAEVAGPAGLQTSDVPALFLKASSSVVGPTEPIALPGLAPDAVDYEGEIALVIGSAGADLAPAAGWDHVFGVTAANDVSARDVQQGRFFGEMADPTKAKSFDTFTPLGPWVVTPDEYPDRDDIQLTTHVNDELRQSARSSLLIHPVPAIISAVSRFATLTPGDVILTGTPSGVGMVDGRYLRPGDVVRVEVQLVGALINTVGRDGSAA